MGLRQHFVGAGRRARREAAAADVEVAASGRGDGPNMRGLLGGTVNYWGA